MTFDLPVVPEVYINTAGSSFTTEDRLIVEYLCIEKVH